MITTTSYQIQHLNAQLVLIRWQATPHYREAQQFISVLADMLAKTDVGLYFISDLRKGRVTHMQSIQQLTKLSQHEKWLGSVAFTDNPISEIFAGSFRNMLVNSKERNAILREPDKAIAFLEGLQSGLTNNIDWNDVLS